MFIASVLTLIVFAQPPLATCEGLRFQRRIPVSTGPELIRALDGARPGDLILLADGTYEGRWTVRRSGTPEHPIVLCGSRNATLQDTGYEGGAVLTLSGVEHVELRGFTVRTSLWGVRLVRGSNHNRVTELLIHDIGQEALAIYGFSSDNVVQDNEIRQTGRRPGKAQFGEGVYIGTTSGRWIDGEPDRSDRNRILNNRIGPDVTAELIDVKEGTTGTVIRGNVLDGTGFGSLGAVDGDPFIDALVTVQGNDGEVVNNTVRGAAESPLRHGFRVWPGNVDRSWGRNNRFAENVVDLGGASGYAFFTSSTTAESTIIACDNAATGAGSGLGNVPCH